ncbi:MAG: 23S rRNA (adenine(2503)-C(2))-methyltransferase RlmN, partial [Corynebacterium nuruki]|nr:23S rRNA (adenine(2503)-C(2))-methyltransferase RlmN [Corynebacterium nuruki]
MATPVQLQFRAPTRGMPPTHLADLTDDEVKAALKEAGLPGFRANQIAR